jgi:hypothetical protein
MKSARTRGNMTVECVYDNGNFGNHDEFEGDGGGSE